MKTEMTALSSPTVVLACALMCEAKPIVEHFKLKKTCDAPFSVFRGSSVLQVGSEPLEVEICVLIVGIGALNMAAGAGWLGGQISDKPQVWLNIGIAGHSRLDVGCGFIVAKSVDDMGARSHLPPQVAKRSAPLSEIISVNVPSGDYPETGALDMECFAFFQTVTKFTESECVQSYKVVSDNPENSMDHLNADVIYRLVKPHTDAIVDYLSSMLQLLTLKPRVFAKLPLPAHRSTHSQQRQFIALSESLTLLLPTKALQELTDSVSTSSDMKAAINLLKAELDAYQPDLSDLT